LAHWIVEGELWFLLPIVPLLLFSNPLMPLGLVLVLVPWLCRWEVRGHPTVRTPADWPIVVILVMTLAGTMVSGHPSISLTTLCQVVAGVGLFYGVANWACSACPDGSTGSPPWPGRRGQRVWQVAFLLVALGLALALIAPLGTQWSHTKLFSAPRLYNDIPSPLLPYETVNRNVLAGALALFVPVGVALLLLAPLSFLSRGQVRLARTGLLVATLVTLAVVILTQTRGVYLALAVGLLVMALLRRPELLWGTPLLLIGAGAAFRRFGLYPILDAMLVTDSLDSLEARQQIWSIALGLIGRFPLTGIGLGTFDQTLASLYPFSALYSAQAIHHAHNLFLQVGIDLGLPGSCAFVALLIISLRAAWGVWRLGEWKHWKDVSALGLGLLISLMVMVLHGLVDAATWGTKPAVIPWLVMGLSVAAYHLAASDQPSAISGQAEAKMPQTGQDGKQRP
jgi:putative inorganic carbon (HCO3(-)) transporter